MGLHCDELVYSISRMKVKTSITLSDGVLEAVDRLLPEYKTRSAAIEAAVVDFVAAHAKRRRDRRDRDLLDRHAERLNAEATDVLDYQADG